MDMTSEQRVPVPQTEVWQALNDPRVLAACIPGCEAVDKVSDTEFNMVMTAKVGPVKARFNGKVSLADLDPPKSYTLSFEGQGGTAGFGKGQARVTLIPDGAGTRIAYTVKAVVGGKLAQVGSRLIDGVAQKIAADFFANLSSRLGGTGNDAGVREIGNSVVPKTVQAAGKNANLLFWIGGIILILSVIAYFFAR